MINKLFEQPELVIDKVITSASHVRDQKSVSADVLSKIRRIDKETTLMTLDITYQKVSSSKNLSLLRNYPKMIEC